MLVSFFPRDGVGEGTGRAGRIQVSSGQGKGSGKRSPPAKVGLHAGCDGRGTATWLPQKNRVAPGSRGSLGVKLERAAGAGCGSPQIVGSELGLIPRGGGSQHKLSSGCDVNPVGLRHGRGRRTEGGDTQ